MPPSPACRRPAPAAPATHIRIAVTRLNCGHSSSSSGALRGGRGGCGPRTNCCTLSQPSSEGGASWRYIEYACNTRTNTRDAQVGESIRRTHIYVKAF